MKKAQDDPELITRVARLYYVDNLSQVDIARIISASQAKVCRLLRLARELGVVRISVDDFPSRVSALEDALCKKLSLKHAVVIRNFPSERAFPSGLSAGPNRHVVYFGAPVLAELIKPGQVIGLTSSRTLAELIRHLHTFCNPQGLRVVQLMGNLGETPRENDAFELSRQVATAFNGTLYALNAPILMDNAQLCRGFLEMEQVKSVWRLFDEMEVALVGVGLLQHSTLFDRKILPESYIPHLRAQGGVGEMCGRFFNAYGQEFDSDLCERTISIPLEKLRKIPLVVCATAGAERAQAVVVAAQSRLINVLIIDEAGARAALDFANAHASPV